jgi:CHAT domain-containing protein/tetratricopeptide (TPR) repeat protein
MQPSASPEALVDQLLALPDTDTQLHFMRTHVQQFNSEVVAEALKTVSDRFLRADLQRSLDTARLIVCQGEVTANSAIRGLGLLAIANVHAVGQHDYARALTVAQEAVDIYRVLKRPLAQARVEIVQIFPLSCLGEYEQAIQVGERILPILRSHGAWRLLLVTIMNLGIVHSRQGADSRALAMFDEAQEYAPYLETGREGQQALIQLNRAVSLRNLGRFEEAIVASQRAQALFETLGQSAESARARQSLAMTYYVLGRYNEALEHLDQAHAFFLADGRQRDAMLAELFISDCLLRLRRFTDVLDKCQQVRTLFVELGERRVIAQAFINEAVAYLNLGQPAPAFAALQAARQIFSELDNQVWVALTDLELAGVLHHQGRLAESLALAQTVAAVLRGYQLVVEEAQAQLIAARAALGLNQPDAARQLAEAALTTADQKTVPALTYQGCQILAHLAEAGADPAGAMAHYAAAIQALEQLRGRLMLEFRADFVADKQEVYEHMVRLCLATAQPALGLDYAERAKSRALLDLLSHRLDLQIRVQRAEDQPLVDELLVLRAERDRLYRRWESDEELKLRGRIDAQAEDAAIEQQILTLEKRITALWHKLLIHNADYAREAALWQVRTEPLQPYLPADTVLLEYFVIKGDLIVFVVTTKEVCAHTLPCTLAQVQQLLQLWQINLNSVPTSAPAQIARLTANAQGLLHRLYQALVAPVAASVAQAHRVIIVPHGPLHYLPFHALFDGQRYWLEQCELSYLPAASLLCFCQAAQPSTAGAIVYSHSLRGKLPYTAHEAAAVAELLSTQPFQDDALSVGELQARMAEPQIIHLATHGDFRTDNPLFSGLVVGNGWLTTLDIFNLRLRASLVTLSACQTGRTVVQGGDELAGLMKAFLSAGAASVVLSLWSVEDHSTAQLMEAFYRNLAGGQSKGAALRNAQQHFLDCVGGDAATNSDRALYRHPYFWAPFFLVGDPGRL